MLVFFHIGFSKIYDLTNKSALTNEFVKSWLRCIQFQQCVFKNYSSNYYFTMSDDIGLCKLEFCLYINVVYILGIKIQTMKTNFIMGGTWHLFGQSASMIKIYFIWLIRLVAIKSINKKSSQTKRFSQIKKIINFQHFHISDFET